MLSLSTFTIKVFR